MRSGLEQLSREVETVVLSHGGRGMNQLARHLRDGWMLDAARFLLDSQHPVLLATGFHIVSAGCPETDGPAGTVHLGAALERLGRRCLYVSEPENEPLLRATAARALEFHGFTVADGAASRATAQALLESVGPVVPVSIERAGLQPDHTYRNMRWADITDFTAMVDVLFEDAQTVCVGDGGNEIGMGRLAGPIVDELTMPSAPVVGSEHLVLATTSNWGAYGLIALCSALAGVNLLPDEREATAAVERCVAAGAVDGVSGRREVLVDGFSMDVNAGIVGTLLGLVDGFLGARR